MKFKSKIISVVTASILSSTSLFATTLEIKNGWSMYGLTEGIEDINSTFNDYPNDIKSIWAYDNTTGKWKFYSSNNAIKQIVEESTNNFLPLNTISPQEGFWIYGYNELSVNILNNENNNSIIDINSDDNTTILIDDTNTTTDDNTTILIDTNTTSDGNTTSIEDNISIETLVEIEYNVCKSTEFGLVENIDNNELQEFDTTNPFSYINTGVNIKSTSKEFNIFYNHIVYNNNLDNIDMYISVNGNYLSKIEFKQEFLNSSFLVVYNNKRYMGIFKESQTQYNLTLLEENNTNYPPLIGDLNQTLITTVEINDINKTISYCDQNSDDLTFNITSQDNTIADATIIDNILVFDAKKVGHTNIILDINDGQNNIEKNINFNVEELTFDNTISSGQTQNNILFNSFKSETIEFNTIDNLSSTLIEFDIIIDTTTEAIVKTPNNMTGIFRYTDDDNISYIGDFGEAISNGEITLSNN